MTTRRFALYSDIHGNAPALEAVYADIAACGIAERYCLGDLVGYGATPREVIALVRASGDACVRGNYDDGIGFSRGDCGCYYPTPEARAAGEESYRRTDAAVTDEDRTFLASLPDEIRFEANGVRVLLVHGSPRQINEYLMPDRTDEFLAKLSRTADADLVCVGHVHIPYHRTVTRPEGGAVHWVSDGSVGKPRDGDPRACWAEVSIAPTGETAVEFHRVTHEGEVLA